MRRIAAKLVEYGVAMKKPKKTKSLPLPRMDYESEKELLSILKGRQGGL